MNDPDVETELKIPVADLEVLRSRLEVSEARLVSNRAREVNQLFDTHERELAGSGCLLRLRSYGTRRILTYKGPASYDGTIKVRPELEVEVEDLGKMQAVLEALGYTGVARYEKDRETWCIRGVEVVLDHTPMGDFVEVEGPSELLESVTRWLGLEPSAAVRGSYMSLWAEYREANPGMDLPPDMVFSE